jgi:predicted DCC family thiol-disulfide oxidoreductase YuxK
MNTAPYCSIDGAPESGLTVYYDGGCPLCSAEVGYYTSRVGGEKLRLVDVSDDGANLGSNLSRGAAKKRFQARRSDGKLISGAAAFVAVWDELPGWRRIARNARTPGMQSLLELAYQMFLKVRPMISAAYVRIFGKTHRLAKPLK